MSETCGCGCGLPAMLAPLHRRARRQRCGCGCQQVTPLAAKTDRRFGQFKGQPLRYIHGHNTALESGRGARIRAAKRLSWAA